MRSPRGRRKLRPIACAEPLLKFAEMLIIKEEIKDVLKKLEPRKLGCGTPDCCGTAGETHEVMGMRTSRQAHHSHAMPPHWNVATPRRSKNQRIWMTWRKRNRWRSTPKGRTASSRTRGNRCGRAPASSSRTPKPAMQVVLGIDLENDYGRRLRSAALKGANFRAPRAAAIAATQWKARTKCTLVQGRNRLEDDLDGARRLARCP